ncbi:flagellar hook-basal body complex protein FliE [Fusibacter sp. JL216-2]|uniref:flagellar hook-basal body complex protein FliE n=1 Tax=Fusibacter sp. JL216-2 TaxID=3071453 RepID=UPI003D3542FE
MKIDPKVLSSIQQNTLGASRTTENSSVDFKNILMDALENVNSSEKTSQAIDQKLALGDVENLHELRIEAMKAELTLNTAIEVRNKIMEAYKEIMRLQF